jgi:phosphoribosylanthranilate isomerase
VGATAKVGTAVQQSQPVGVVPAVRESRTSESDTVELWFDRIGLRVAVRVSKSNTNGNAELEAAYARAVQLKGEAAARQIRMAVESVEKDPAKQAAMLLKAVGA